MDVKGSRVTENIFGSSRTRMLPNAATIADAGRLIIARATITGTNKIIRKLGSFSQLIPRLIRIDALKQRNHRLKLGRCLSTNHVIYAVA
jgi:hypothetical protein